MFLVRYSRLRRDWYDILYYFPAKPLFNFKILVMKGGIASLLLAGAAAYGYYKYSKMSDEEKRQLLEKGKKFVNDNLGVLKNMFGQKHNPQTAGAGASANGAAQNM